MKKVLIGVGALALIGAGYYFYTKNKSESSTDTANKPEELDKTKEASDTVGSGTSGLSINTAPQKENTAVSKVPTSTQAKPSIPNLALRKVSKEVSPSPATSKSNLPSNFSKKQIRETAKAEKKAYKSVCGRRPLFKFNRGKWQACVDKEKASLYNSFDGYDLTNLNNFDL